MTRLLYTIGSWQLFGLEWTTNKAVFSRRWKAMALLNYVRIFNSSRSSDEYVHQLTSQSMAQIIASCLFRIRPISEPVLVCYQFDHWLASLPWTEIVSLQMKMSRKFSYDKIHYRNQELNFLMHICVTFNSDVIFRDANCGVPSKNGHLNILSSMENCQNNLQTTVGPIWNLLWDHLPHPPQPLIVTTFWHCLTVLKTICQLDNL